ncbi:MAG: hypothetical protein ACYC7D_05000 [Nitrososphaerales archaeon]
MESVMPSVLKSVFESGDDATTGDQTDLFDVLREHGLRIAYEEPTNDCDVLIRNIGDIDLIAHRSGTESNAYTNAVIERILQIKKEAEQQELTILFSDHGASDVIKRVDLLRALTKLPFVFGQDYLVFLDATICRFWFFNYEAKEPILSTSRKYGRLVTRAEKEDWGIDFDDNRFGDEIFVAYPGSEIYPDFFHPIYRNYMKAVHGYHPDDEEHYGILATSKPLRFNAPTIFDIAPTVLAYFGIECPKQWVGRSLIA